MAGARWTGFRAAAKKAEEDYASASFVLQQAHDDLDALYRQADQLGERPAYPGRARLETVRLKVNMLSGDRTSSWTGRWPCFGAMWRTTTPTFPALRKS